MFQLQSLGHIEAQVAINAIEKEMIKRNLAAVITVADINGELLGLLRVGNCSPVPITIAINKAFTASRIKVPTSKLGHDVRHPEDGFDICYLGDKRYVGWGGGFPVEVDDQVVGAIAVSGLTEQEDSELAGIGVAALLRYLDEQEAI